MRSRLFQSAAAFTLAAVIGLSSVNIPNVSAETSTSAQESGAASTEELTTQSSFVETDRGTSSGTEGAGEEMTSGGESMTSETKESTKDESSFEESTGETADSTENSVNDISLEPDSDSAFALSRSASASADASPLIVTEIVPAGPTSQQLTYTEVYNNSDATINFGEYTFYYQYPSGGGQVWNTGEFNIEPGKTIVLWQNSKGASVDTFNAYYGTNLIEGKDIYRINYSGIHPTAQRGFAFGRDENSIICYAECNVGGADITDRNSKLAVQYQYSGHGTVSQKKEVSTATPGTVADWQVPDEAVHYETPAQITVSDVSGPATLASTADTLDITAKVTGNQGIGKAYLHYRQADGMKEETVEMIQEEGSDTVTVSVPKRKLWSDSISWYVSASYGGSYSEKSSEQTTAVEYPELTDEEKAPLVVTEVVTPIEVSSGTYQGNSQFSYVELYNRTSSAINYSYYKLFYEYTGTSTADKTWTVGEPVVMVQPGDTIVVWLSSNGNTVDDFNAFYGTDLTEGQDIVRINYAGFHNTQWRTLKFGRTADKIFACASFNEGNKATIDKTGNQSIQYTYPRTADGKSLIVTTDTAPTPGTVEDWQVPADQSRFTGYDGYPADDGTAPSLTLHDSCPASILEGEEMFVTFDIADNMGLLGTKLYYRLDNDTEWSVITETSRRVSYYYLARIPADVLFGHDSVEFYVEAFNNFRSTKTGTYKIAIDSLNEVNGIRLNVDDSSILRGVTTITANDGGNNASTKIKVDGSEVTSVPVLENGAYFALTATGRDSYFKNAVTAPYGEDSREIIRYIAKWADLDSKVIHIDNKYFSYGADKSCYEVTLTLWAGDSGTPFEDLYIPDENHEDYTVTNLRLLLANGKEYLPVSIGPDDAETSAKTNLSTALDAIHTIGDSAGMCTRLEARFEIPAADVTAVGYELDTTELADGVHTITAEAGGKTVTASVTVDNTAPSVEIGIGDDEDVTGTLVIDPQVSDEGGVAEVSAVLDGTEIELPYSRAVRDMEEGSHELTILAEDLAGNLAQNTIHFNVSNVDPEIKKAETTDITSDSSRLSVSLEDINTEGAQVSFYKGKSLTVENGDITVKEGEGDLPYQLFTIQTGEIKEEDSVFINWNGTASNADSSHAVKMYVFNTAADSWEVIGTPDAEGSMEASFAAKDHLSDGKALVLVQCRAELSDPSTDIGEAGILENGDQVTAANDVSGGWDGTGRPEDYDFSFAWITDTQYYCESWPEHYMNQNQWIVDNADDWKIKYVLHTGDIVDEYDMIGQWENADKAMKIFDDAGMPYGVLAGNHDVAAGNVLYQNYWNYFGEDRFSDMPCYGGSYNNNAGHYDLLSQNGQDFIMLYMSWDIYTDEIDWMNEVLAKYPDRKAIILLHRYTNVRENGGTYLDYAGKVLQEQVVAKNPNVIAVLNGHYHGSSFETAAFDDDKDGIKERTVYQICTDYQSAFEGGEEYIKFLYFDLDEDKVYMNSYSPLHDDFNYYDTAKYSSYEEGEKGSSIDIFELNVDFDTTEKTLECSQFSAGVRTAELLGTADVSELQAEMAWTGLREERDYTWYASVTNDKGGLAVSSLQSFVTEKKEEPSADPSEPAEESPAEPSSNNTESTAPTAATVPTAASGGKGTSGKGTSVKSEQVKTGDSAVPVLWAAVLVLTGGSLLSASFLKKRKSMENKKEGR